MKNENVLDKHSLADLGVSFAGISERILEEISEALLDKFMRKIP